MSCLYTFINDGNRSRCVKYEIRPVEYAPEVMERATRMAFLRICTILVSTCLPTRRGDSQRSSAIFQGDSLFRPLRMILSKAATRSERTASASSRPASTERISELGLVYFLLSTAPKKTVKV